jgi:hypothetical protein
VVPERAEHLLPGALEQGVVATSVIEAFWGRRSRMIRSASISPIRSADQRAAAKKRWALLWCHVRSRPAPSSIPHTVRRLVWPISPVTRPEKVTKEGAVKQYRNSSSSAWKERGIVVSGGIGGSLLQGAKQSPPMLPLIRDQSENSPKSHRWRLCLDTPKSAKHESGPVGLGYPNLC